jgi:hypothetical protein
VEPTLPVRDALDRTGRFEDVRDAPDLEDRVDVDEPRWPYVEFLRETKEADLRFKLYAVSFGHGVLYAMHERQHIIRPSIAAVHDKIRM